MISKTIGFRGLAYFQTHPNGHVGNHQAYCKRVTHALFDCSILGSPTPAKSPHEEWHWFLSSASRNRSHKPGIKKYIPIGSMVLLYMVCHGSHQYTSFMLAYIPAPWILWDTSIQSVPNAEAPNWSAGCQGKRAFKPWILRRCVNTFSDKTIWHLYIYIYKTYACVWKGGISLKWHFLQFEWNKHD